jgi:hypothetical protein
MLSGACATSQAAITDLGSLSAGVIPTQFSGSMIPAGDFSDYFTFVLPANGGSGYGVQNHSITFPGGSFNTVFSTLSLFSDTDSDPFSGGEVHLATVTTPPGGAGGSLNLAFGPTGGGNMFLRVSGFTNGDTGGIYSGAISVSPVPEPEVWAMMLIGVGLVGFRLRHRSKQASAARFA